MERRILGPVVVAVSLLAAVALGVGTGAGQQGTDSYAIEQGVSCTELEALSYEGQTVEEFYGYTTNHTGSSVRFSANTPIDLEEDHDETSSLFLYRGPEELSLVVLHGATNGTAGGAATFEFVGLPEAGEWVVMDDPESESVENWNRTTAEGVAVDWGWRGVYTDGGAFEGGLDDEFEIRIVPAFDEDAELDPITPGNVTEWRALSFDGDASGEGAVEAISLDADEPVTVRSGGCS